MASAQSEITKLKEHLQEALAKGTGVGVPTWTWMKPQCHWGRRNASERLGGWLVN